MPTNRFAAQLDDRTRAKSLDTARQLRAVAALDADTPLERALRRDLIAAAAELERRGDPPLPLRRDTTASVLGAS